jgi:3-dehydroquinate synthase
MADVTVNLGERSYPIYISDSFRDFGNALTTISFSSRLLIVTDSNVDKLYADSLASFLEHLEYEVLKIVIPAGEKNKNLETVSRIYEFCRQNQIERKDTIIALGGGVVGDIAGFAAATYLRGINFIQVPTTIIAVCDSSVGGKTGVDFGGSKNIIGAFYQPKAVYINLDTLKTLSQVQYVSGFAEVVKHALIEKTVADLQEEFELAGLFEYLEENTEKILEKEIDCLSYIIKTNCLIKSKVVEFDEKEKGIRAILNFGHTIGHAIESSLEFRLTHGECVALGMIAACSIAVKLDFFTEQRKQRIIALLTVLGIPTNDSEIDIEKVQQEMKNDKKVSGGKLHFVLPKKIGEVIECNHVDEGMIRESIRELVGASL